MLPSLPAADEISDFYMLPIEDPKAIVQAVFDLVQKRQPGKFEVDPVRDIQVLCPMNRSITGARAINQVFRYASQDFRDVLKEYGITASMSRRGDCWDNACSETLFGSLKVEQLYGQDFETRREAKNEVIDWLLW